MRLVLIVLVIVTVVSLTRCSLFGEDRVDPPKLAALKTEPLATMRLPGGKLLFQFEQDADPQPAFDIEGGGTDAKLVRAFGYPDAVRARQGRAAAIKAAQASGWKLRVTPQDPNEPGLESREPEPVVFGRKALVTGGVTLIIGAYWDKADGRYKVSIDFEHRKCPPELCGSR